MATDWRGRFADAYRRELQDLVSGGTAGASAWDGPAATVVAQATLEALATGERRPVALQDRPPFYC